MKRKSCCIVGHKNLKPYKSDHIKASLEKEILQAIQDGYTHFISGFDEGAGLIAAEIVAGLKTRNPALTLEAALPYRGRIATGSPLFHRLLGQCSIVGVHNEEYDPFCIIRRNRAMVSLAQRLIAVYDGCPGSDVSSALRCAYAKELEIRIVHL